MKTMRARSLLCAFLLGTIALSVTDCPPGIKKPCSLEERVPVMEDDLSWTVRYADDSASDLCIAEGEGSFDESYVTSEAVALFDVSDRKTLYNKEAFERLYPVNITKVTIALVAIKNGNLNVRVVMTDGAAITESGATLYGTEPGDTLTLGQPLHGLMLPPGNDAGTATVVRITGSIDKPADMMGQGAASLGATGTHFVDPHELSDPDYYTMTYNLYLISSEALKYPIFRQVAGTTPYTVNYHGKDSQAVTKTWKDRNWLMTRERGMPEGLTISGGKAGTTSVAGCRLIVATRDQNDREYVSVILKSDSRSGLYNNMTSITSKIVKQWLRFL